MGRREDEARKVLIGRAQASLLASSRPGSPLEEARKHLASLAPIMLAPVPIGPPPPTVARRVGRGLGRLAIAVTFIVLGVVGTVAYSLSTGMFTTATAANGVSPTATPTPVFVDGGTAIAEYYAQQALLDALQRTKDRAEKAEAEAAAATAAAAAATEVANAAPVGGTTGGSTGGKTGGTPGGGAPPAPAPPAAAYLNSLNVQVSSGAGSLSIEVRVTSTGGAVSVGSATASISGGGGTISLSGPSSVNGSATYTGSAAGLAPGSYTVTVHVGELTQSTGTTVF